MTPTDTPTEQPGADEIRREKAIAVLAGLLSPIITHHHGMAAAERDRRFRQALRDLVGGSDEE